MQILDHQHHRRPPPQLSHQRRHHHVRPSNTEHEFLELAPDRLSYQTTAPADAASERLTRSSQHPHRRTLRITERAHQHRLAHPSLTGHPDKAPLSADPNGAKGFLEHQQIVSTLQNRARTPKRGGAHARTTIFAKPAPILSPVPHEQQLPRQDYIVIENT